MREYSDSDKNEEDDNVEKSALFDLSSDAFPSEQINQHALQRARLIIGVLFDGDLSPELLQKVHEWLVDDQFSVEKNIALWEAFNDLDFAEVTDLPPMIKTILEGDES